MKISFQEREIFQEEITSLFLFLSLLFLSLCSLFSFCFFSVYFLEDFWFFKTLGNYTGSLFLFLLEHFRGNNGTDGLVENVL